MGCLLIEAACGHSPPLPTHEGTALACEEVCFRQYERSRDDTFLRACELRCAAPLCEARPGGCAVDADAGNVSPVIRPVDIRTLERDDAFPCPDVERDDPDYIDCDGGRH